MPGCLALLFLFLFGPFLIQLLYVGPNGYTRASCQSNLKQLGLALIQYAQDNDNQYPPITQPAWREAIYPFVKSTGVYQCPDDRSNPINPTSNNLPHSYAANVTGWNGMGNPSEVITVVDVRGYEGPEWNITSPAFAPLSSRELYTHKPRHIFYDQPIGRLNCLFADGHVKSLIPMATLSPVVNLWTRDNVPFTGPSLQNAQAILQHAEHE